MVRGDPDPRGDRRDDPRGDPWVNSRGTPRGDDATTGRPGRSGRPRYPESSGPRPLIPGSQPAAGERPGSPGQPLGPSPVRAGGAGDPVRRGRPVSAGRRMVAFGTLPGRTDQLGRPVAGRVGGAGDRPAAYLPGGATGVTATVDGGRALPSALDPLDTTTVVRRPVTASVAEGVDHRFGRRSGPGPVPGPGPDARGRMAEVPGPGAVNGTVTGPRPYTGPPTEGFDPFPARGRDAPKPVAAARPGVPPGSPMPPAGGGLGPASAVAGRSAATGSRRTGVGDPSRATEPAGHGAASADRVDRFDQTDQEEIDSTGQFARIPGNGDGTGAGATAAAWDPRVTEGRADARAGSGGTGSRPVEDFAQSVPSGVEVVSGTARSAGAGTRGRPVGIVVNLLLVVIFLIVGFSVGQALAAPGSASAQSRVGNWARDHHLTFLVDTAGKLR